MRGEPATHIPKLLTGKQRFVSMLHVAPEMLHRVTESAMKPGSMTLLLGEPGVGKTRLAYEAACAVVEKIGAGSHLEYVGQTGRLDRFEGQPQQHQVVLIDHIERLAETELDDVWRLLSKTNCHVIATARKAIRNEHPLMKHPALTIIGVGTMTLEESRVFVTMLLGVVNIEEQTLRHWHRISSGNSYALAAIAIESDRSGSLKRTHGYAWAEELTRSVPIEVAQYFTNELTEDELELLEVIAMADPVSESELIDEFDKQKLAILVEHGLVHVDTSDEGTLVIRCAFTCLRLSLLTGMDPLKFRAINRQLSTVLHTVQNDESEHVLTPAHALRLVLFELESGHTPDVEDLVLAMQAHHRRANLRQWIRVAFALATHEEASPQQIASAIRQVVTTATGLRAKKIYGETMGLAQRIADEHGKELGSFIECELRCIVLMGKFWGGTSIDTIWEELQQIARICMGGPEHAAVITLLNSIAIRLLAYNNQQPEAWSMLSNIPWDSYDAALFSPIATIQALFRVQRGELDAAYQDASETFLIATQGDQKQYFLDLLMFGWFVSAWGSGDTRLASRVLETVQTLSESPSVDAAMRSDFTDAAHVMLFLRQGQWEHTVKLGELVRLRFAKDDPYGLAPVVQACVALAYAVLGDRTQAATLIQTMNTQKRGLNQALSGFRDLLALRARQWLQDPSVTAVAHELRQVSELNGNRLIELYAIHIIAFETGALNTGLYARSQEIAQQLGPQLAGVLIAHIDRIVAGITPEADQSEDPDIRLLAEVGTWLPIHKLEKLTAREREIVILAAFGHSNRFIAERLYISSRTAETHLLNAFRKIGVRDREDLREWVLSQRTYARQTTPSSPRESSECIDRKEEHR